MSTGWGNLVSDLRREAVVRAAADGLSCAGLAQRLGTTPNAMQHFVARTWGSMAALRAAAAAVAGVAVAARRKRPADAGCDHGGRKAGAGWTAMDRDGRIAAVRAARQGGLSYTAIAERYGISRNAVAGIVTRYLRAAGAAPAGAKPAGTGPGRWSDMETGAREAAVLQGRSKGLSWAEIARTWHADPASVQGVARRLGLMERRVRVRRAPRPGEAGPGEAGAVSPAVEEAVADAVAHLPDDLRPRAVTLLDLGPGDCRFVVRVDAGAGALSSLFCGLPVRRDGESWCGHHAGLVYVQPAERRRAERITAAEISAMRCGRRAGGLPLPGYTARAWR